MMHDLADTLRRRRQAGDGKIGLIITLAVIVFIVLVLLKYVPVRVQNAEFAKDIEVAITDYVVGNIRGGTDNLLKRLLSDASEREIPLDEENIDIDDNTKFVRVTVEYSVVVDMPWGEWPQDFVIEKEVQRL